MPCGNEARRGQIDVVAVALFSRPYERRIFISFNCGVVADFDSAVMATGRGIYSAMSFWPRFHLSPAASSLHHFLCSWTSLTLSSSFVNSSQQSLANIESRYGATACLASSPSPFSPSRQALSRSLPRKRLVLARRHATGTAAKDHAHGPVKHRSPRQWRPATSTTSRSPMPTRPLAATAAMPSCALIRALGRSMGPLRMDLRP